MTRYEYCSRYVSQSNHDAVANELGLDGWELMFEHVIPTPNGGWDGPFKLLLTFERSAWVETDDE
jgi:hypothetical protein